MKPIVEKVLRSGIVDKSFVELLEKWGNLPEGSSELVKNEGLKNATKEQLQKFAQELADEVTKEHVLRETQFDLEHIKWPTVVTLYPKSSTPSGQYPGPEEGVYNIPAMIDQMGRLYFRPQDVDQEWFVPGFYISRSSFEKDKKTPSPVTEMILETTPLFAGDQVIAIQVTTSRINTY